MKSATKQGSRSFAWGFAERAAAVRRRSRSCAAERSAREKRHRDLTVAARSDDGASRHGGAAGVASGAANQARCEQPAPRKRGGEPGAMEHRELREQP